MNSSNRLEPASFRIPLRLGIMINTGPQAFWVVDLIRRLAKDPRVEIVCFIENQQPPIPARKTWWEKLKKNNFFYHRFDMWETRRHERIQKNRAPVNVDSLLKGYSILRIYPEGKGSSHRFLEKDLQELERFDCDVLLRFGFNILRGGVLSAARYGVWSYHHGDNDEYRGGPAGFWEIYEKNNQTGITLQVLTEELDAGLILGKTFVTTIMQSPAANRAQLGIAGARLLDDAFDRLISKQFSPADFFIYHHRSTRPYLKSIYRLPTNSQMLWYLIARFLPFALHSKFFKRYKEPIWTVGWIPGETGYGEAFNNIVWYPSTASCWIADPFPWRFEGKTYLFVEEFVQSEQRGRISVTQFDPVKNQFAELKPVLEMGFHLSFPFLFESGGTLYMMPEQSDSGQLDLYRCVRFPNQWVFYKTLLRGHFADSVLFHENKTWWLLTTKTEAGFAHNNLYLYSAEEFDSDQWVSHPENPICNSLVGARMAGSIFRSSEGRLIRPGQNCQTLYGGGIELFELLVLTKDKYEEQSVGYFSPALLRRWNKSQLTRFHTWNPVGDGVWIDAGVESER